MSTFGDFSYPVANRQHRCVHCWTAIVLGEKHRKFAGKWEGDFQNWRVHEDCAGPQVECQDDFGALCDEKHKRGTSCRAKQEIST